MKKNSLQQRWPYFFGQRNRSEDRASTMPELIMPEPPWEEVESGLEDILRWEEEGGKTSEANSAEFDQAKEKKQ